MIKIKRKLKTIIIKKNLKAGLVKKQKRNYRIRLRVIGNSDRKNKEITNK